MLISRELDLQIGSFTQGQVTTDDGVQLLYQSFGQGPAIVWANGIGARYPAAMKQIAALRETYQVICWDYRGMGQSVMPDPAKGDVALPRQARDSIAILDHLQIEEALFIGWSMGVPVALEVVRQAPERVAGLVALLGACGRPFHQAFPAPVPGAIGKFFSFIKQQPAVGQAALNLAVRMPNLTFQVLSLVRFLGPETDREILAANVRALAGVEKALHARTMLALAEHDATDLLPQVRCPALIIAGGRDYLTPPRTGQQMAAAIPHAMYKEMPRGTHFALIEQPALINTWLLEFAQQVYSGARPKGLPDCSHAASVGNS